MHNQLKAAPLICFLPRSVSWKRAPSAWTQSWPSLKKRLLETEILFPDFFLFNFTEWLYQMGTAYDGWSRWETPAAPAAPVSRVLHRGHTQSGGRKVIGVIETSLASTAITAKPDWHFQQLLCLNEHRCRYGESRRATGAPLPVSAELQTGWVALPRHRRAGGLLANCMQNWKK